ncbi:hypothetical protein WBP07_12040 [Novosphingobium sp. BL-8A]
MVRWIFRWLRVAPFSASWLAMEDIPQRLEAIAHLLGLAPGGRPGAEFAKHLMMPMSKDTLLRVVRRRAVGSHEEPRVIGIDDFAFRRGQTYEMIVCDLERRRQVTCLPDRAMETLPNTHRY